MIPWKQFIGVVVVLLSTVILLVIQRDWTLKQLDDERAESARLRTEIDTLKAVCNQKAPAP